MRRNIPLFLFLTASVSYGSVVFYTNQSAFLQASQQIPNTRTELETFDGPGLNIPVLSFQDYSNWPEYDQQGHILPLPSYLGYLASTTTLSNGVLNGCEGHACFNGEGYVPNISTLWSFNKPIFAFGATFQYLNRDLYTADGVSGFPYLDGFSGFVSDQPLTSLLFTAAEDTTQDP
jgi:hypothetical protein